MAAPRIALIHALKHSPPPIEAAFAAAWPQAQLMNLLDDSLSADLARDGALTPAMTQRFVQLGRYAAATGADAILFTCSAFGPCIEAVARDQKIPVLKPNEAMIEEATAAGGTVGLMATFAPTLASMPAEFPPSLEHHDLPGGGRAACARPRRYRDPRPSGRSRSRGDEGLRRDCAGAVQSRAQRIARCASNRQARTHHARQRSTETKAAAPGSLMAEDQCSFAETTRLPATRPVASAAAHTHRDRTAAACPWRARRRDLQRRAARR